MHPMATLLNRDYRAAFELGNESIEHIDQQLRLRLWIIEAGNCK